jgi:serine/threonine protein kinase
MARSAKSSVRGVFYKRVLYGGDGSRTHNWRVPFSVAEHEPTGREVAIKILHRDRIHSQGLEEKVRREIVLMSKLRHAHVIRLCVLYLMIPYRGEKEETDSFGEKLRSD